MLNYLTKALQGRESGALEARWLLEEFPDLTVETAEPYLERLKKGEPFSRVIGKRGFWDMMFKVTPDVLDPRPESELILEALMELKQERERFTLMDIGTGSGCLAIAAAKIYLWATIYAVDMSEGALAVARENAQKLLPGRRIHFMHDRLYVNDGMSWRSELENILNKIDVIISNPPYIPTAEIEKLDPAVKNYDPHLALDGGDDGLNFYRELRYNAYNLSQETYILLEIGEGQGDAVRRILEKESRIFEDSEDYSDLYLYSNDVEYFEERGCKIEFQKSFRDYAGIERVLLFKTVEKG